MDHLVSPRLREKDVKTIIESLFRGIEDFIKACDADHAGQGVYIVVYDPGGNKVYKGATPLLHEVPYSEWKHRYDQFARQKAFQAMRDKRNTGSAWKGPWLLQPGDVVWSGGVYYEGWAIGVSGVAHDIDEGIAYMILAALEAVSKKRYRQLLGTGRDHVPPDNHVD